MHFLLHSQVWKAILTYQNTKEGHKAINSAKQRDLEVLHLRDDHILLNKDSSQRAFKKSPQYWNKKLLLIQIYNQTISTYGAQWVVLQDKMPSAQGP